MSGASLTQAQEAAFDRELLAALPKVRGILAGVCRDAMLIDDLVQDVTEKALRYRASFTLGTNMTAWLCFIGKNQFFTHRRRAWRWQQPPVRRDKDGEELDSFDLLLTCAPGQQERLELEDVLKAVSYLPDEMRNAVMMAADGLSYEEIASELGIAEGTVNSRVSRGRTMLGVYFNHSGASE